MAKFTFEEVKKDYLALISTWGHPHDMTGGFIDAEQMEPVILNPSRAKARDYLLSVIQYGFQDLPHDSYYSELHGKINVSECPTVKKIWEKYIAA